MLTDYHLHLRPDEEGTTSERYFTAENVDRYLAAAAAAGVEELGVSEHVYRFRQALDLWRHPLWESNGHDDLDAYCEFVRGTPLKLGIECDFVPGAEDRTAALLEARDFDYVVGSVHFIGEATRVDHPGWDVWEGSGDPDEVWRRYFEALAECARSGLFDILAHPDLVKVWGRARPLPERDLRAFYEPAVEAIAESGIAVEVSTAGLRKPVGELYPAPRLRRDVRRGRGPLRALLRRPPARAGRLRLRPRGRLPRRASGWGRYASSSSAGGGWRRSQPGRLMVGIGYDSHRFADGPAADPRRGRDRARARPRRPLRRRRPHPRGDRRDPRRRRRRRHRHDVPRRRRAWQGADSIDLLRTVVGTIAGPIVNVDATVICEQPRLGPYRAEMERTLADATSARVSVKATSNEGMGWIGRGEGIACIAVASVAERIVFSVRWRASSAEPRRALRGLRRRLASSSSKVLHEAGILGADAPRQGG